MGKQVRRTNKKRDAKVHSYSSDQADYGLKQLEHDLALQGLCIKEITGDGNCLFRSLADQLGTDVSHSQIRHEVVVYLRNHAEEFSLFVEEDFEQYVDRMSNDGVYGDNLEIVAFARTFQKQVKIYQPGLSYIVKGEDGKQGSSIEGMLHIVYHSYEHYSSVRNRDGPHDGPPEIHVVKTSIPPLKERSPNSPASDLEKICLSSVPGSELNEVRKAMKTCNGNINAAVDLLLENQCEDEAAFHASRPDTSMAVEGELDTCSPIDEEVKSSGESGCALPQIVGDTTAHVDNSGEISRIKPEAKKLSARDKKEQAKRLQKEAARERKRKAKTRSSTMPVGESMDQTKTIII